MLMLKLNDVTYAKSSRNIQIQIKDEEKYKYFNILCLANAKKTRSITSTALLKFIFKEAFVASSSSSLLRLLCFVLIFFSFFIANRHRKR